MDGIRLIKDNELSKVVEVHNDDCECGCADMNTDDYIQQEEEVTMKTSKRERLSAAYGKVRSATTTVVSTAKKVNLRSAGHRVGTVAGSVASHLSKPAVSFVDGIREGWKNGS